MNLFEKLGNNPYLALFPHATWDEPRKWGLAPGYASQLRYEASQTWLCWSRWRLCQCWKYEGFHARRLILSLWWHDSNPFLYLPLKALKEGWQLEGAVTILGRDEMKSNKHVVTTRWLCWTKYNTPPSQKSNCWFLKLILGFSTTPSWIIDLLPVTPWLIWSLCHALQFLSALGIEDFMLKCSKLQREISSFVELIPGGFPTLIWRIDPLSLPHDFLSRLLWQWSYNSRQLLECKDAAFLDWLRG